MKTVIKDTLPENVVTFADIIKKPNQLIIAYSEDSGDFYKLTAMNMNNTEWAFTHLELACNLFDGVGSLESQLNSVYEHSDIKLVVLSNLCELVTLINDVLE